MVEGPVDILDCPIFVLGHGRSGTTLVQRLINTSDEAKIWGEHDGFLEPLATSYFALLASMEERQPGRGMRDLVNPTALLDDWRSWPGWANAYTKKSAQRAFGGCIRNLFSLPQTELESEQKTRRWGFKEIRYAADSRVLEMLNELFPTAAFVFVVRDPVEVVASALQTLSSRSVSDLARRWNDRNLYYLEFSQRPGIAAQFVQYRDLRPDNVPAVARMFESLGLALGSESNIRELLASSKGRYQAPSRKSGRAPQDFLGAASKDAILMATREARRALGMSQEWQLSSLAVSSQGAGSSSTNRLPGTGT